MKHKEKIIALLKQGISINKISKQLGIGKSTIYYHYKKINGKKNKPVTFHFSNQEELGEFIGIFAGDGYYHRSKNYQHVIQISAGAYEVGYRAFLKKALTRWFDKKPLIYHTLYKGKPSCYQFLYSSRPIHDLIKKYLAWEGKKTYTVRLLAFDAKNHDFNKGFLRGLIDTDGSYYPSKRRVSFSTVSCELARNVFWIMQSYRLAPYVNTWSHKGKADLYTLTLHGENAKKLLELITPHNPNKALVV